MCVPAATTPGIAAATMSFGGGGPCSPPRPPRPLPRSSCALAMSEIVATMTSVAKICRWPTRGLIPGPPIQLVCGQWAVGSGQWAVGRFKVLTADCTLPTAHCRLLRVRLTRASSCGPFPFRVCNEERRHRLDLVGHDLRAPADHEENQVSPLLPGLLVDLEHPAERRVTRGADLRHHRPPLFDLRIVAALRTNSAGPRHHQRDRDKDEALTH